PSMRPAPTRQPHRPAPAPPAFPRVYPPRPTADTTLPERCALGGAPSMRYTPKPHVSAALAHLRHGITACALVVVAAAVVQMLVFGFVHFTQVRFEEPKREVTAQPLSVVAAPRPVAGAKPAPAAQNPGQPTQAAGPTTPPPPTPTDFRLL